MHINVFVVEISLAVQVDTVYYALWMVPSCDQFAAVSIGLQVGGDHK